MSQRPQLSADHLSPEATNAMASFHADIVKEVKETVAGHDVVIVGMAQNPVVKKARVALAEAGIPYEYLTYGSYFSQWKQRLAIKLWSGWPTFPQVYVKGTLIGGAAETIKALEDGSFKARLEGDGEV